MKRIRTFPLAAGLLAFALPLANGWSSPRQTQTPDPVPATTPAEHHQLRMQQEQQNQNPDPIPGSPAAHHLLRAQQDQQAQIKTFTGKIAKTGQKFVLQDGSLKVSYQLDDQKKAQPYRGKKVVITGTHDVEKNIIHVQAIE